MRINNNNSFVKLDLKLGSNNQLIYGITMEVN